MSSYPVLHQFYEAADFFLQHMSKIQKLHLFPIISQQLCNIYIYMFIYWGFPRLLNHQQIMHPDILR